MQLLEKQTI